MTGLALHALHYGLLVAGLVTVGALAWSVRRGRRAERDHGRDQGHDDRPGDGHDERVRRLRAAVGDGLPGDVDPGGDAPPSG